MLPSPPKLNGFTTRKSVAAKKQQAAAAASSECSSSSLAVDITIMGLPPRSEVSTKLFDPSPPRHRAADSSSSPAAAAAAASPLVDITNNGKKRYSPAAAHRAATAGGVKPNREAIETSLVVPPASLQPSTDTTDAATTATPFFNLDADCATPSSAIHTVTPVKQMPWFPAETSPVDCCTLVMLSSAPRALTAVSPEPCFTGAAAVKERETAAAAAAVRASAPAAAVSPVPCRTLPRRTGAEDAVLPVASPGINTTPRRGLDSMLSGASAGGDASVQRWESPSLLKQRHMRQLIRGPLFDQGAVSAVSPQRQLSAARSADGRSPNPGQVVLFDGVAAVVGDPSKLRFTPKPPATRPPSALMAC